ncbi:MAG: VOC family protein [Sphingobacteriia bacterium]|nr:VOC family protein [Sphingobacteriia bacterium]
MEDIKIRPGQNLLTTTLSVADTNKSLEFYTKVFGFFVHQQVEHRNGKILFARLTYNGYNIVLSEAGILGAEKTMLPPVITGHNSPISLYIYCNNLEEKYEKFKSYGLTFLEDIKLQFWGDKIFRVVDINGYIWDFAQMIQSEVIEDLIPDELK